MKDHKRIIHRFELTVDGVKHFGRVRYYDERCKEYTGDWTSATGEHGKLGYGLPIGSSYQIQADVERQIRERERPRG